MPWRVMCAFIAGGFTAILLALALAAAAPSKQTPVTEFISSPFDDEIHAIDRQAVRDAYQVHVSNLFVIWMKDDTGQPARFLTGVRKAQRAYIDAMVAIDARGRVPQQ